MKTKHSIINCKCDWLEMRLEIEQAFSQLLRKKLKAVGKEIGRDLLKETQQALIKKVCRQ